MNNSRLMLTRISHAVNAIWYLEILGSLVFIWAFLTSANIRKQFIVMLPVDFAQFNVRHIKSVNGLFENARLDSYSGTLVFQIESNWKNVMLMTVGYILIISVLMLITYQVKKIFINFKKHQHFSRNNVNRLRIIAAILTISPFVRFLFSIFANQVLGANLNFGQFLQLTPSFNYGLLLTGLILFSVVEIFKLGIELEEENKLTV